MGGYEVHGFRVDMYARFGVGVGLGLVLGSSWDGQIILAGRMSLLTTR